MKALGCLCVCACVSACVCVLVCARSFPRERATPIALQAIRFGRGHSYVVGMCINVCMHVRTYVCM